MRRRVNKVLFFLLLMMPICVNASDYLLCGNDKKIPLVMGTVISILFILIRILVPVLLVITGMISFLKATISSKVEDQLQKAKKSLVNKIVAAVIMACDGMHFSQTRIATVDSFLVMFMMISYLFMIRYIKLSKDEKLIIKLRELFFCGLFMGFAIDTKWSAMFGAAGLAVIFFVPASEIPQPFSNSNLRSKTVIQLQCF